MNTVSTLCCSSVLSLLVAACGISSLGSGVGGDGGSGSTSNSGAGNGSSASSGAGNGSSSSSGAGAECRGPNPAGCRTQGCPAGQSCVDEGCTPSSCDCDPATGSWICTDDCGGGTCVADEPACRGPNPAGCRTQGCPAGETCVDEGCTPSSCDCDPATGSWICTDDCGGGTCVADEPACRGPNPAGCRTQGCPAGQSCVDEGCTPSSCDCDPATGSWSCTDDCGGGTCVPDETECRGPNPVGCRTQGCPAGETCVDEGCTPSRCGCDPATGSWICTDDCGGGTCVPDEPDETACRAPSPAGCKTNGCPAGQACVDEGCTPSSCGCDAARGVWICTADCGGGICVPDSDACSDPNPVGCRVQGCPEGQICVDEGCAPSVCGCDAATGTWYCTDDCGGGTCVRAP
ncbi:hypothetical protein [Sorangium sp. So ce542]|uniref:hypothetical protein n=1 Tax=Sorangium sp. So ce542 TaxID=3133316 RepID=UPI003F60AB63